MCYLRFDKAQMTNLQDSLFKELLITNRSGAYCNTTLVGCNIRKYHGLMVIPVPNLNDENHVLLSSLDETVIQHGAEFNLGLHKYQGDNYSPKGHKYIVSFEWEKVPTWIYRRRCHAEEGNNLLQYGLPPLYPLYSSTGTFRHHASPPALPRFQVRTPVDA